jgi:hypothetical protein
LQQIPEDWLLPDDLVDDLPRVCVFASPYGEQRIAHEHAAITGRSLGAKLIHDAPREIGV